MRTQDHLEMPTLLFVLMFVDGYRAIIILLHSLVGYIQRHELVVCSSHDHVKMLFRM
ncbi:hypothetical protein C8R48DRAFT_706074 [Suillus tomentosus]|nr:hypothetical protein C8R48DRAFT_706074 [Suillus tomentosus]